VPVVHKLRLSIAACCEFKRKKKRGRCQPPDGTGPVNAARWGRDQAFSIEKSVVTAKLDTK
jgi:hypothetical protein